jgi:hypothetical protein
MGKVAFHQRNRLIYDILGAAIILPNQQNSRSFFKASPGTYRPIIILPKRHKGGKRKLFFASLCLYGKIIWEMEVWQRKAGECFSG